MPASLASDSLGNLYIANIHPPQIWYVNRSKKSVTAHGQRVAPDEAILVAGNGLPGFGGDGGPAVQAQLQRPGGMALDGRGNLYVADPGEHSVRRIDRAGIILTVAGTGSPGFNGDGYKGRFTAVSSPSDLAIDGCGNLLIADAGNERIRRLNLEQESGQKVDKSMMAGDLKKALEPEMCP